MGRRAVVVAACAVVAAAVVALVLRGRGSEFSYPGAASAPGFSFRYEGMHAVPPGPGQLARLEGSDANGRLLRRLTAAPVELPASPNPVSTTLPFASQAAGAQAAKDLAGYDQLVEGFTRLNIVDGKAAYMVGFTATGADGHADGGVWVGKTLLIPEPGSAPSKAVAVELLERVTDPKVAEAVRRFPAGFLLNWPSRFWVQQRTAVDIPSELERPLKTFSFG